MSFVFCLLRAWRALICPVYRFLRYEFFQVKPISEIISAIFELDNGWAWWGCPIPGKDFLELQGHRNDQGQTLIFNLKNIIQFQIYPEKKSRAQYSVFSCPDRRPQGFPDDFDPWTSILPYNTVHFDMKDRLVWLRSSALIRMIAQFDVNDRPLWFKWSSSLTQNLLLWCDWSSSPNEDRPFWFEWTSSLSRDRLIWCEWSPSLSRDRPLLLKIVYFHPIEPSTDDFRTKILWNFQEFSKILHF